MSSYPDLFDRETLYIKSVSQTGERNAVVEATLRAAFRFEKVGGRWQVREVRIGDSQWEKIDGLMQAVEKVRIEDTRQRMELVAAALQKYWEKKSSLPDCSDYVSLSDALSPEYLNPLIRLDAWQHPLSAQRIGPNAIRLVSSGPDGYLGTNDDLELSKTFNP